MKFDQLRWAPDTPLYASNALGEDLRAKPKMLQKARKKIEKVQTVGRLQILSWQMKVHVRISMLLHRLAQTCWAFQICNTFLHTYSCTNPGHPGLIAVRLMRLSPGVMGTHGNSGLAGNCRAVAGRPLDAFASISSI